MEEHIGHLPMALMCLAYVAALSWSWGLLREIFYTITGR